MKTAETVRPTSIDRDGIIRIHQLIRSHIRRTPIVEVDAADFGLAPVRIVFKLELLQHSGSFKPRGAFANMLTRVIPASGVVAASGGNHGAAVAYAAMKVGKPARIFVPGVASAEKRERIRGYGADLVVTGERYVDALLASEEWAAQSGALQVHAYDQVETLLGQGTTGLEFEDQDSTIDTLLVAVGGGGLIGGVAAWYSGRIKIIGVEPEAAPTLARARGGASRRCAGWRNCSGFVSAQARGRTDVPHRPEICRSGCVGPRRGHPSGAGDPLEGAADCRRAGRRRSLRGTLVWRVSSAARRASRRSGVRRQYDGGGF